MIKPSELAKHYNFILEITRQGSNIKLKLDRLNKK